MTRFSFLQPTLASSLALFAMTLVTSAAHAQFPPNPPTNVTATGNCTGILVAWKPATTGTPASSYDVYRDVQFNPIAQNVTTVQYQDNGVAPGVNHTYYIQAFSLSFGGGGLSALRVTPPQN